MMGIKIEGVQSYRDGGTLEIKYNGGNVFCSDNRISAKGRLGENQYAVYPCYPSKGDMIDNLEQFIFAKSIFLEAINFVTAFPCEYSQEPAIRNGLDWIENKIKLIFDEVKMPLEVARMIARMEGVCESEGVGPNTRELIKWIGDNYPILKSEFSWLSWEG